MSRGTVKFFNESKGFGFIIEDDTNKEYFVHVTGLIDKVKENDEVEYDLQEGRKGLNAINVKKA
ncbi:MAG: cold shock domain-containing protein [Crocinitomicaceae bacterium]|jgi:CspA family cold shock protein|nr:cold shock domain-containing protein [Crocinitomicaceae bacterium]MBP6032177.1 cold shock domain-containing protein [Crocinitomicaceae bacterium]MDP4637237.1 cold shock domain-containing protein [Crocinitomicaceae bacterium]MDP4760888.1 cold shock domain-containing protein [Crocinitomicaceae bacterium]